jgi:hypothetical protein
MVPRVPIPRAAVRLAVLLALIGTLAGCGSGLKGTAAHADGAAASCPATVMSTVRRVVERIYNQGLRGEKTGSARHMIENSSALRRAVESGDAAGARAAGQALIATGHLTNLLLTSHGRTLVSLGGPALTPLKGAITAANGKPLATYVTSVWSDEGFVAESSGVSEGRVALRQGAVSLGGSIDLAEQPPAVHGTLTSGGVGYEYTSFAGTAYPAGAPLQVYLFRPLSAIQPLCGASAQATVVNTLSRIAHLIYDGETGRRTLAQVRRVQRNQPLLAAVARRDPAATRRAVAALLHQHIVRLRVSAAGKLLSDLGGPFVLAPVRAPLKVSGRTIGSFVLSIQDDEGYLRLTRRLVGLKVLMYMQGPGGRPRLVKNSLGPAPGTVPESGPYSYRGSSFEVLTVNATAFPSGPLTIRVLVPVPYR